MKRIVISGTYCTGKTTLSLALERASGISCSHALTMREILPKLFPGKSLRDCSYAELICLGMKRFEDRIRKESELGNSLDRKSTRLNSSHVKTSYAVFCLKKKKPHAS